MSSSRPSGTSVAPAELLKLIHDLATELHRAPPARALTLDSSLERDAGLDSLGRVELVLRIEQRFGVRLAEALMASAETPRDLLRGVLAREDQAAPAAALESIEAGGTAVDGSPDGARTLVEA
ncbi:MAG: acyl carrier protein, partial [Nitrospiria bacterium]